MSQEAPQFEESQGTEAGEAVDVNSAAQAAQRVVPELTKPEDVQRRLDADMARYDTQFESRDSSRPSSKIINDELERKGVVNPLVEAERHGEEIVAAEVEQISANAKNAPPRPQPKKVSRSDAQRPWIRKQAGYDKRPDK